MTKRIKVCYVLCYRAPNYTRTVVLISALNNIQTVNLDVIRNENEGILRYPETFIKLIKYRKKNRPDVFVLGFRGHEVFGLFYPFMRGSKIIFDEFINHHDWLINEHKKFGRLASILIKPLDAYMRWAVKKSTYVLEDTEAHAELSAKTYQANKRKFQAIPVGADENLFKPMKTQNESKHFGVFFYGNMLPLHGLDIILEAIKVISKKNQKVHFTLVGGKGNKEMLTLINDFINTNKLEKTVTHLEWVDYNELPRYIAEADLCLGGPFGDTSQASRVITGKTFQFLAMGKPTVISMTEEAGFIDKKNVILCERGSVESLAGSIEWSYKNRDLLNEIGKGGRLLYTKEFSVDKISKQLSLLVQDA